MKDVFLGMASCNQVAERIVPIASEEDENARPWAYRGQQKRSTHSASLKHYKLHRFRRKRIGQLKNPPRT
jgi:hypothetical protein